MEDFYIDKNTMEPLRLLVDMDGTVTEFKSVDTLETLYEEGYFRNLKPNENVINAVKQIIYLHPEIEVYVMSAVLTDSQYALNEKNEWLDEYLPQIDKEHRIFPPCGENKLDYVPGGIRETDHLLDDYTKNLTLWEPPARGIKILNGINHTHETWQGNMLRYDRTSEELANRIVGIMKGELFIRDEKPQEKSMEDIVSQLNAIREDIREIQESMNIPREERTVLPDSLEERYTEAMMLCGWRRVVLDEDSPMTIAFENRYGTEKYSFDGWEMVGQELEDGKISPILYTDINRFEELIYPTGRISYYTKNLGGTGLGADAIPIEYEDFREALAAYENVVKDGASLGYMINGATVELTSFSAVDMQSVIRNDNWIKFPELAQNEVAEVRTNLEYLRHTLERINTSHAVTEGFKDILINSAVSEIIKSKNIWGSWGGRIANTHRPQDYVEIDITGYQVDNHITCEVLMIHANEIQDAKEWSIYVDTNNFEQSITDGAQRVMDECEDYFRTTIGLLGTDTNYPMELYAKGRELSLESHYRALEGIGYTPMADRKAYFDKQNEKSKSQTEDVGFTHVPKTIKPRL